MQILSKQKVHEELALLNPQQQDYILQKINQSKKSKWLEVLARNKGISISKDTPLEELEKLIDWVLLEIKDSGYGNRHYRCMCGTPLRYQYIVLNKKNGEQIGLGETCFQNHTNLPTEVVKDIVNEFHKIDLIRDEIIYKIMTENYFDIKPYLHLENIPPTIKEQAEIGLPLTDKQIAVIKQLKDAHDIKIRIETTLSSLKPQAREIFDSLTIEKQEEILEKLGNYDFYGMLPDGFKDAEIETYLSLGLPLLDVQMERIYSYNRYINRKQLEEKKAAEEEYWSSIRERHPIRARANSVPSINYESLLDMHMDTLIKVAEMEEKLSPGMRNDWLRVQAMVNQCREGLEFDYSSFKLNLSMICYSLNLGSQPYL
jgi:hypothetical protein